MVAEATGAGLSIAFMLDVVGNVTEETPSRGLRSPGRAESLLRLHGLRDGEHSGDCQIEGPSLEARGWVQIGYGVE